METSNKLECKINKYGEELTKDKRKPVEVIIAIKTLENPIPKRYLS